MGYTHSYCTSSTRPTAPGRISTAWATCGSEPAAGPKFPLYFHGVPKRTPYDWNNRLWFHGTFCWWGDINYHRDNVPGDNDNRGWSLKFFE